MPQASSAARNLSEDAPQAVEAVERVSTPERVESAVEKALSEGSPDKVVSIFKGRAAEEKQALERLGGLEPNEAEAVPEEATRVTQLTETARQKIDQVTLTALEEVRALLGTPPAPANENAIATAPAPLAAAEVVKPMPTVAVGEVPKAEAAPVAETVQIAPTIAVGEAPKAEAIALMPTIKVGEVAPKAVEQEVAIEKSEEMLEAEEQLEVAAEVMKENYEALNAFAQEHGLSMNEKAFEIDEKALARLTKPERSYAQVLMGKHAAGKASMLHAEKLLEAYELPAGDPNRNALMKEADTLAEEATLREKGAQAMQQNYMNLPEIIALSAGGGGNDSGGSYGGANFDAQASPFGEEPKTPSRGGAALYDGGGAPGSGLTNITAYKTSGEKVEKRKPNFIERFFNKNWKDMTYGSGGDGGSRE